MFDFYWLIEMLLNLFQIYADIDETLTSEHGLDPEIQANIQHLAQKLFDNVRFKWLLKTF